MTRTTIRGMTLIETTLALLIAALVSAYAVPAYREYLARGHRQAAVHALYACALQLEAGADAAERRPVGGTDAGSESTGACTSTTSGYRIAVRGAGTGRGGAAGVDAAVGAIRGAPLYLIEATPQPHGPQRRDRCGVFTLDAAGRYGNRRADASGEQTFGGCWSGMRR
ncbi:MAG: type IV pilin protein [Janthinobacterium lividum]